VKHRFWRWQGLLGAMLSAVGIAAASDKTSPQAFVITDPTSVQAAESLFQEVQSIAVLVARCVEGERRTRSECLCERSTDLGRLKESVDRARVRFPEWESKVVNWFEPSSRQSRSMSLEAVARQASISCPRK
jgi:hypothetical protein